MIKLFEVENFKSFENAYTLNFMDVRDYKFKTQCIENNLLSKIIVYGKNSVGKTNLGYALFDITTHLVDKNVSPQPYRYYTNFNSDKEYARFNYVFDFDGVEVIYTYKKTNWKTLIYEELTIGNNKIFSYDAKTKMKDFSGLKYINADTLNWEFTDDTISALRYIANNTTLEVNSPIKKIISFVSNMLWFRSLEAAKYIGFENGSGDIIEYIIENELMHEFQEFLYDSGVKQKIAMRVESTGEKSLYFQSNNSEKFIPFAHAVSSGTWALTIFYYWYKNFSKISFLFIDEFDAFYHFELAEKIVNIMERTKSFQTILTSHNTNLLSNKIMRPDCYFILTQEKLVSFVNSTERELREGHNLEKLYMSGEFNE